MSDVAPERLFELWHEHRALILAAASLSLAIVVTLRKLLQQWNAAYPSQPVSTNLGASKDPLLLPPQTVEKLTVGSNIASKTDSLVARTGPKRVVGQKPMRKQLPKSKSFNHLEDAVQPIIFFSSLAGATEKAAQQLSGDIAAWINILDGSRRPLQPQTVDISYAELDDYFVSPPKGRYNVRFFYIILQPSYDIDTILDNFTEHLQETHNDFRIDTAPLSTLVGYTVFGFGDKEGWPTEHEGFCSQARTVDKWMAKLTARKRAFPLGVGDVKSDAHERLQEWRLGLQEALLEICAGNGLGEGVPGSGDAVESDEGELYEDDEVEVEEGLEVSTKRTNRGKTERLDDLEDLGSIARDSGESEGDPIAIDFTTYKSPKPRAIKPVAVKEMVPKSSPTYASLTKQGYSIVGSHSGVKICRWTKSALRGRGSCYKYSFYGIQSHLCMEATPSLSCSNKCVFCWRHGTNPVGTTWRWVTDAPDVIYDGITTQHYKKIKMMKGVPGVRAERFAEAMRIRHCALSLVGEPIFYPHINELLAILHKNRISTFLVCNAQHPEQLATLTHVTQLYVSIDASNRESLRRIDRPLHRDFWERFLACMDILRARRHEQRTVFRLTLVKGFNIEEEVAGYADLVERALPGFVEVKGVTYCGTSASSTAGLTMQNVPFYAEVCDFVRALAAELGHRGLGYGIAAEHEHSCCILLASERFKINDKWCTRIDYKKFFELVESGAQFGPDDYVGQPTPEWALWGNGGFDPRDQRMIGRKGKRKGEVAEQDTTKAAG